jgi:NAD(P)-dependent dehydrogenase (short-subunit alcohol dehydrogenase family)
MDPSIHADVLARYEVALWRKQNSGHVVNISAVLADQPSGGLPTVLAVLSKSPMPVVSKALALEYAANNIRFNTVSPGML